MFIRKKKYPSGNVGVIVVEKVNGRMRELHTVGIASATDEIAPLVVKGQEWMDKEKARRHPCLDLFGEERQASEREYLETERVLSNISNVFLNGADLLLDHVFDSVGFNKIEDAVFRQLVKARLSYPASKAATVEYLKNHFDEDLNLSKIYRYLDKLREQHDTSRHLGGRSDRSAYHDISFCGCYGQPQLVCHEGACRQL